MAKPKTSPPPLQETKEDEKIVRKRLKGDPGKRRFRYYLDVSVAEQFRIEADRLGYGPSVTLQQYMEVFIERAKRRKP